MDLIEQKVLELVKRDDPANPMGYVRNIMKDHAASKLQDQMSMCESCGLCNYYRSTPVFHKESEVLVVTDYLRDTAESMLPYTEKEYNDTLSKVWEHFEYPEEYFSYINAMSCTPVRDVNGKEVLRMPSKQETENCKTFVSAFTDIVHPKGILLLGPSSSNLFINKPFTEIRGEVSHVGKYVVMATYHPSYFDRAYKLGGEEELDEVKNTFIDDIELFLEHIKNY